MSDQNQGQDDIHHRLVRVILPYHTVQPLFTGEVAAVDRLPEDAHLVRTFEQGERNEFNFVFRHESFDPVQEGEVIPAIRPEYRRLTEPERDVFESPDGGRDTDG